MINIREGDLYERIEIGGHVFEIRYGYYDPELERGNIEPMPIYPDLSVNILYTTDGYRLVTADQEICEHFKPKPKISDEGWCNDCEYLKRCGECLGICKCETMKKR